MDPAFSKLAQKIYFQPSPSFENARVLGARLSEQKVFKISLQTDTIVPLDELISFYDCLSHNFPHSTELNFRVKTCQYDLLTLKQYLRWIVVICLANLSWPCWFTTNQWNWMTRNFIWIWSAKKFTRTAFCSKTKLPINFAGLVLRIWRLN